MSDLRQLRVLVTRPARQADEFAEALRERGALPVHFPVIEITPMPNQAPLDRALARLECYDWVVFTSANGVRIVFERLKFQKTPAIPPRVRLAAIGPKTASALVGHGRGPDYVPQEFIAEAILPGLGELTDRWVLLPRAEIARPALPQAIESRGGIAHEIAVYRTLPAVADPAGFQALRRGVDVVTFTSSSTVTNFAKLTSAAGLNPLDLPGRPAFACIGPITADTAREVGFSVDIIAETYTTRGLLAAIEDHFQGADGDRQGSIPGRPG